MCKTWLVMLALCVGLFVGCQSPVTPTHHPAPDVMVPAPLPPTQPPKPLPPALPRPNHPLQLAYMIDDSFYGNVRSQANGRVTNTLVWSYFAPAPQATWIAASFVDAQARGWGITFGPNVSPADTTLTGNALDSLDAAAPYWASVQAVYFDELGMPSDQLEAYLTTWRQAVAERGLTPKPIWINFTSAQIAARTFDVPSLDCVGVEAYVNPASQNDPAVQDILRNDLSYQLSLLGGRCAFVIGQAYDRNGAWTNIDSLAMLQLTTYNAILNNTSVRALWWFSLARPGGTLDHPPLAATHSLIAQAVK